MPACCLVQQMDKDDHQSQRVPELYDVKIHVGD
jgi:hypothetical protein